MRIIVKYEKGEPLRFISHLDVQRLMQRSFRRARIPLAYSQGFNPHPLFSFASALAVGYTSQSEWLDVQLEQDMPCEELVNRVNEVLPEGFRMLEAKLVEEKLPTLTALTTGADYRVTITFDMAVEEAALQAGLTAFLAGPIVVNKKTKAGLRDVDIRPQLLCAQICAVEDHRAILFVSGELNSRGSLNIDLFLQAMLERLALTGSWRVHREEMFFENTELLPNRECAGN